MKFDVIVGNPPYQAKGETGEKTHPIWDKFVAKSFELLKKDGYLCMVHPSGWRDIAGRYETIKSLLINKCISYLEIHGVKDGIKTFGATTRYDWYVVKNNNNNNDFISTIQCEDGKIIEMDLSKMPFIPNGIYNEIQALIAKEGEETVEILNDCKYHTQKTNIMSKVQTSKNKYPCVMSVSVDSNPAMLYYSNEQKGHFGVPKVIFTCLGEGVMVDEDGKFGLSQHCAGIVDLSENLQKIHTAMKSKKFVNIMKNCSVGGQVGNVYVRKIIALFRKDFWKEFVDADGNEI